MKYMFLIYNDPALMAKMTPAEQEASMQAYFGFNADMGQRGILVSGEGLHEPSAATTVRVREGQMLTSDGPFAETKEFLGGYYILNCKDLDEAIEMARKIPSVTHGSIEIRPVTEYGQG